jgi:hypothetical protein
VAGPVAATGCGGSGGSVVGGLVAALPPSRSMVTVDLAGARRALGLPADADGTDVTGAALAASRPLRLLAHIEELALPYAASPLHSPLPRALDGRRISAIAPTGEVSVVRTRQPFSEIDRALRATGYIRDGDRLVPADRLRAAVLGGSEPVVSDLGGHRVMLDGRQGAATVSTWSRPRDLLGKLDGPVRYAAGSATGGCGAGLAASLALPDRPGALVVVAGPRPDAGRLLPPASPLRRDYAFQRPTVDGELVTATYTDRSSERLPLLLSQLDEITVSDVYRCR